MNARLALPVLLVLLAAAGLWVVFGSGDDSTATHGSEDASQDPASVEAGSLEGGSGSSGGGQRTDLVPDPGTNPDDAEELATSASVLPSFYGVVADESGAPIPEVVVHAYGLAGWAANWDGDESKLAVQWQTTTDTSGRFAFPATPRDRLRFLIEFAHPDFAEASSTNQPAGVGRSRDLGVITMGPGFVVEGTVFDAYGTPLAAAEVTPYRDSDTFRFSNLKPDQRALLEPVLTDDQGQFRLENLPQRAIRLQADASHHFASWSSSVQGQHGESIDGLEIHLGTARQAFGLVIGEHRAPLVDARVVVTTQSQDISGQGRGTTETTSDAQGGFEIALPEEADRMTVTVGAEGYWVLERKLKEADLEGSIEFELKPIEPLTGLVVNESGQPIQGATVRLVENRQGQVNPRDMVANAEVLTGEDGSFTLTPNLRNAWGGRFTVYAWDDVHAPGASAMFRLRSADRYKAPDLNLVLVAGYSASGTVVDPAGNALTKARVHLRKLRKPRRNAFGAEPGSQRGGDIFAHANTDLEGKFTFTGLSEGDYRIEAFYPGLSPVDSEDFGLIDTDYETRLQLHEACGIAGMVEGPVDRFRQLRVTANAPGFDPLDANVAADGSFLFEEIMPGTWNLQLRDADQEASGMAFAWGNTEALARLDGLEVPPGAMVPATLQIDLAGRSGVTGTAKVNGVPAADYAVFVLPQMSGGLGADDPFGGRNLTRQMRVATTDYAGRYSLAALPSGDFWVILCRPGRFPDNLHGGDSTGPSGLQRRDALLRNGTDETIDFDVQIGSLALSVLNPGGGRGTRVRVVPMPEDGRRSFSFQLRSKGYNLQDVAAGEYDVLMRDNAEWISTRATIFGGGTQEISLTLPDVVKKKPGTKAQR
ncbi:MAG: carboxypeptidase-like regulatory domain-containing protein [Planctomycetota bacterium]